MWDGGVWHGGRQENVDLATSIGTARVLPPLEVSLLRCPLPFVELPVVPDRDGGCTRDEILDVWDEGLAAGIDVALDVFSAVSCEVEVLA